MPELEGELAPWVCSHAGEVRALAQGLREAGGGVFHLIDHAKPRRHPARPVFALAAGGRGLTQALPAPLVRSQRAAA